jgi:hypothetical protein
VIGAAAMAARGVSRGTRDVDLLAVATDCLTEATWHDARSAGVDVRIRRGDPDDPLAGVVRFTVPGEAPVDLVVGKAAWQADILRRAIETSLVDVTVPIVTAADLILLKLYAGGPQDAWDIAQLVSGPDARAITPAVDAEIGRLPSECRELWDRIKTGASGAGRA